MTSFTAPPLLRSFRLLLLFGFLPTAAIGADAPPGDPFIKKAAPTLPSEPPANVIFTMEIYNLGLNDAAKVLQETDSSARFAHLLDLQKAGKAHVAAVLSGACTSGDQSLVETTTIMRYGIAFDPAGKATDYKERQVGYRLVYKGQTISDGKSYDAVLFFEHERFAGFDQISSGKGTVPQPQFQAARMNMKTLLPFGQVQLLGTPNSNPNAEPTDPTQTTLSFGKVDRVTLDEGQPPTKPFSTVTNELSFYSMPIENAAAILNARQTANSAYDAVCALVKTGEAKLERVSVVSTQPGVKSNSDEITEVTYPRVPGGTEFQTQDVGLRIELQPDPIANSSVFFVRRMWTQWNRLLGNLQGGTLVPGKGDLPVFGVTTNSTSLKAALGGHELIGTFTPPSDSGLLHEPKPDHRIWMEFIQVTAANP